MSAMASASDSELDAPHSNSAVADEHAFGALDPATPQETGPQPSSQITLPSTEIPGSPIDPIQSFKTEANDDRPAITVIPSSLTPPPSTQVAANNGNSRRAFSNSQQSALFSPPATVPNTLRDRDMASDYNLPTPHQVLDASTDELRAMLQTCIAEHQKLKMEAAHHKLQYNLLSMQAEEESKRAAVEHDMVRREVDALRMTEHSRQARRELSTTSESLQTKYLQMKMWYETAMEENEALNRRVKLAKKVIQRKEEETIGLVEEREMLLNRIKENREHFHMLCSPGGIFHGALTPKHATMSTPQQLRATPRQTPHSLHRDESDGREHGLSALLEAMSQSQDNNNNSAPSTPMVMTRPAPRLMGRHNRNAQSMSSLPTTPLNRPRGEHGGLLPSVNLVAQSEPRSRYSQRQFIPATPPSKRHSRRKSRESTISVEDNEELARQALESVKAVQSLGSQPSRPLPATRSRRGVAAAAAATAITTQEEDDDEISNSQASQAATEMLRRQPSRGFDGTPGPAEKSATMQAKLFPNNGTGMDKRKFSGSGAAGDESKRDRSSPSKKMRASGQSNGNPRVGLGIQY